MKPDDAKLAELEPGLEGAGIVQAGNAGASGTLAERLSPESRLFVGLLDSFGTPPLHFRLWNGESVVTGTGNPVAAMYIANRSTLLKLLVNPELHFGDAYSDGSIEIDGDLVQFLELIYRGLQHPSFFRRLRRLSRWLNRRPPHPPAVSRGH